MKKFFILLMVVLMLAGLTFGSFAMNDTPGWNGQEHAYDQGGDPIRDRDGSCQD
jgi:hypothetical protein